MKKNDVFIETCIDYSSDGFGICKPEGFVIFVRNLLVGEKAKIVITKLMAHQGYGKVLELLEPSAERIENECPAFPRCGGCSLRCFSKKEENRFKQGLVERSLERIGHISFPVNPIIGYDDENYRNKMQAPVSIIDNHLEWGFYRVNSHDLIPCQYCQIEDHHANELMETLVTRLDGSEISKELRHILIRAGKVSKEYMIVLVTRKDEMKGIKEFAEEFIKENPEVKAFIQNINNEDTNVILGKKERLLAGREFIYDTLGKLNFMISAKSFYQVNPIQVVRLYDKVKEYANLTGKETVIDLYCGIGTISLWLADKAKQVIGIEVVNSAIEDAKKNCVLNKITNARFILGDAGKGANQIVKEGIKPDVVVVDPPRKGLDDICIQAIETLSPERLIYVSCNPATLARDLAKIEGYQIKEIQPVDMFPRTNHCESVCLLSKVNTQDGSTR